jgi:hypothetical protein
MDRVGIVAQKDLVPFSATRRLGRPQRLIDGHLSSELRIEHGNMMLKPANRIGTGLFASYGMVALGHSLITPS